MSSGRASEPTRPRFVLDQPGGNLVLDLFVLHQHLGTMLDTAFAGTGVTPAQYAVYAQLARGARTPGQLVETLGLRPATLSGYLAAMQERGHLTRSRSTVDGRSALVSLTPEGVVTRTACRLRMRRALTALGAQLGSTEVVEQLRAALGRLDAAVVATTAVLPSRRR